MGDKSKPIRTRSSFKPSEEILLGLVSLIEPTSVYEALLDTNWILAMQEELDQFSKNDVLDFIPEPKENHVIGTKWVFRSKLNEQGGLVRKKPDWLHKAIVNKKELTILKSLHQLPR